MKTTTRVYVDAEHKTLWPGHWNVWSEFDTLEKAQEWCKTPNSPFHNYRIRIVTETIYDV